MHCVSRYYLTIGDFYFNHDNNKSQAPQRTDATLAMFGYIARNVGWNSREITSAFRLRQVKDRMARIPFLSFFSFIFFIPECVSECV